MLAGREVRSQVLYPKHPRMPQFKTYTTGAGHMLGLLALPQGSSARVLRNSGGRQIKP
jgi:hypothetical protein